MDELVSLGNTRIGVHVFAVIDGSDDLYCCRSELLFEVFAEAPGGKARELVDGPVHDGILPAHRPLRIESCERSEADAHHKNDEGPPKTDRRGTGGHFGTVQVPARGHSGQAFRVC